MNLNPGLAKPLYAPSSVSNTGARAKPKQRSDQRRESESAAKGQFITLLGIQALRGTVAARLGAIHHGWRIEARQIMDDLSSRPHQAL